MVGEKVPGGDATPRSGVDDPHLESIPIETKMAVDAPEKPLDGRVGPDRTASPRSASSSGKSRLETRLIGFLREPLEAPPVGSLEPLQDLGLGHGTDSSVGRTRPEGLSS